MDRFKFHNNKLPARTNSTAIAPPPKPNGSGFAAWQSKSRESDLSFIVYSHIELSGFKPSAAPKPPTQRLKSISGGKPKPRKYLDRIFQDDDSDDFDDPHEMDDFIVNDKVKIRDGEWKEEVVPVIAGPRTSRRRFSAFVDQLSFFQSELQRKQ